METMNKVTDCGKWVYIDKISKDDVLCANQIHCDTRDFHCLFLSEKVDIRDRRQPELKRVSHVKEYHLHQDDVLAFLKSFETASGGKGTWRFISLKSGYTSWFKYIRLVRVKDTEYFFVCVKEDEFIPIKLSDANANNIVNDQDTLNFISK
jgi:hypothetical protein